jgi:hypothetical protein
MMNRAKNERPHHDRVRVKPGEKPAATPVKPQHDDAKLLTLLQSAKRELQGLRLVHLHLSLLKEKSYNDISAIRRAVQEISENSAFLQMFNLSNEDVIILYKGIKFSAITDVCQKIERLMLSRTSMTGINPYREESLYSIMELSLNFVEGVPEERRILHNREASLKHLIGHAVIPLLPSVSQYPCRQVRSPSQQAKMAVPALPVSIHTNGSAR